MNIFYSREYVGADEEQLLYVSYKTSTFGGQNVLERTILQVEIKEHHIKCWARAGRTRLICIDHCATRLLLNCNTYRLGQYPRPSGCQQVLLSDSILGLR